MIRRLSRILLTGIFSLIICISCNAQSNSIPSYKVDSLVSFYKQASGVMIINFWSTWCKPCIEEIPHFIKIANKYKDQQVSLLLVSQDTKALYESGKLQNYIKKSNWGEVQVVWLNETNAEYYCPKVDSSWDPLGLCQRR
jgi:thiol-disulfide isomerase/thioredoxin